MGRNSAGTYSLPLANRTPGTTITSTWANTSLTDIANGITESLSRSGNGGMLSQLRSIDGTQAAPGLSFTDELGTGIWRSGTNAMRAVANAATYQEWTAAGCTIALPTTFTTSVSNSAAITATGNGTGAGVSALGGASNGAGFVGSGQGSGAGLVALAGATGNGVTATGGATSGAGVSATGGATSSAGVAGTGGSTNGKGVTGQGTGSGDGVHGTGGSSSGVGVRATGGTGGTGLVAVGGGGGGNTTGIVATGGGAGTGAQFANGTAATGGTPRNALEVTNGYIAFNGVTAPDSTTGITNAVTPANTPKAWWVGFSNGSGGVTTMDAFNITSVVVSGNNLVVTFASAFADANYATVAIVENQTGSPGVDGGSKSTTSVTLQAFDNAGSVRNHGSANIRWSVAWFGRQ